LVSIPWAFAGDRGDAVIVRYNDSDCGFRFAHTAAIETSQLVTIAVYDHYRPPGKDIACPAYLRIATATVQLRSELDGRAVAHAPVWRL